MWSLSVACLSLLASAPSVAAFTPTVLGRSALKVHVEPLRPKRQLPATLPAPARHAEIVASVQAIIAPRPLLARAWVRTAISFVASALAFVFASARVAFAAERTMRRSAPPLISGDMIMYGMVGACILGGSYFLNANETPHLLETPGAAIVDTDTLKPPEPKAPPAAKAAELEQPQLDDGLPESLLPGDDSAIFGSLQARMQALADERDTAGTSDDAPDEPPPDSPSDSSDSWGQGSTAVLEPPRPDEAPRAREGEERGVLDGEPAVEFPTGFPLIDGEVAEVETTPAADAAQIAMLNRMMGLE